MITEEIFYGVKCDRCGDVYEMGGEYTCYSDKSEILDAAFDDDWKEIDGRHYCPHCYVDDDHDYTPKPPIPECIFKMRRVVGMMIGQADGEMLETTDDHLHVRFYMNQHPLNDTILAIIDEMLGDIPHTVVVDEEPHTYDKGVTRRLHIDVAMNFIHKGRPYPSKVENGEIVEMKNEMLDRPITDYPLSVRALNCLKAADINTLRELIRLTEMDLLKFRNFGKKSIFELSDFIKDHDLTWGMNV